MKPKRILVPITSAPAVNNKRETRVLYDSFTGSGAITGHTPEIRPVGAAWAVRSGAFLNLSGGTVKSNGNGAVATIDAGVGAFELQAGVKIRNTGYTAGLVWRREAGGAHYWLNLDAYNSLAHIQCTNYGQNICSKSMALTRDTFYSVRVLTFENFHRFWLDGTYIAEGFDLAATLAGTEVGLRSGAWEGPGEWSWIQVKPVAYKTVTIIGDSISILGSTNWPALVARSWNGGLMLQKNHAVGGQTIMAHMDAQTLAAASDNAALVICNLGTNDGNDGGITAEYAENLVELKASNPSATVIAMGIINRADPGDNFRTSKNLMIATAAANAGCTFWNTDGWIDPLTDTSDGLHPNTAGHIKIANEVLGRM